MPFWDAPVTMAPNDSPVLPDQAAPDAVRQWEYSPTLLNGVPVPVVITVTVNLKR